MLERRLEPAAEISPGWTYSELPTISIATPVIPAFAGMTGAGIKIIRVVDVRLSLRRHSSESWNPVV